MDNRDRRRKIVEHLVEAKRLALEIPDPELVYYVNMAGLSAIFAEAAEAKSTIDSQFANRLATESDCVIIDYASRKDALQK